MKLRPVRIDENPVMKTPMPVEHRRSMFERLRAVRRVERPAGVDAAEDHRVEREDEADDEDVPAEQVDASGTPTSFAPIISGITKLPRTAGTAGISTKKTIMTPCIVNSRL